MIEDWIQNPRGNKGGVDLWIVRETGWRNRVRATSKQRGGVGFRLGIEAGPPDLELLAACAACAACWIDVKQADTFVPKT